MRRQVRRLARLALTALLAGTIAACSAGATKQATGPRHSDRARGRSVSARSRITRRASPTRPMSPLRWSAAASFSTLERRIRKLGRVSVSIQPLGRGPVVVLGGDPNMQGMSTTKVLVLAALLRDRGGLTGLAPTDKTLAREAITQSDNQAILDLFSVLERDRGGLGPASVYMTRLLREAGDLHTNVTTAPPPRGYATTFGQTRWSPSAEVRFYRFLALGCLLPRADTAYILALMRGIEPSERWGLGEAGFRSPEFKGGWGPLEDGQYGVRQTGIVGAGRSAVVVSIAVDPAVTFAEGTAIATEVGRWLHAELLLLPSSAALVCSRARLIASLLA